MKKCKVCGEIKSLDLFSKDSWQSDGKRTVCKKCDAMRAAARRRVAIKTNKNVMYVADQRTPAPPWLTEQHFADIKALYDQAETMTIRTGIKHVVDHIVPVMGINVCGLHVPWNLQILTMSENCRKSGAFDGGW